MAVGADVQVDLAVRGRRLDRGAGRPLGVAAVAVEDAQLVNGVDSGLHRRFLSAPSNATGTVRGPEAETRAFETGTSGRTPAVEAAAEYATRRKEAPNRGLKGVSSPPARIGLGRHMRRWMIAASSILLAGCGGGRLPTGVVQNPGHETIAPIDSTGLHLAPLITNIRATRVGPAIWFDIRLRPRFPGDQPRYDPYSVGGYAFSVAFNRYRYPAGGYFGSPYWIMGWNRGGGLTLWHGQEGYGSDSVGSVPLTNKPPSLRFTVPLSFFPTSEDVPQFFTLRMVAAVGTFSTAYGQGIRLRETDSYADSIAVPHW